MLPHTDLDTLAQRLRDLESPESTAAPRWVPSGWEPLDRALAEQGERGGLACGMVHEWFSADDRHPPLAIIAHLGRQSLLDRPNHHVAWVGPAAWPYPHGLASGDDRRLLNQSIWIDARTEDDRLWAIEQAMRCPAISAVVADGAGLPMPATRRLQLAARASEALVMLARPRRDRATLSAAAMRWGVTPELSDSGFPRWSIELWRAKGRGLDGQRLRCVVEKHGEDGLIHLPPALVDGSGPAASASPTRRRTA